MANQSANPQVDERKVTEIEKHIRDIIRFIGDDPYSEHTKDTPRRVVKSYKELFSGYKKTPEEALGTVFSSEGYDQLVICKDIELYSTCAHHMIPFYGKAHIGYIPGKKVVGLSKLARLVEVFARRLQIQEQLTEQIAESIHRILKAKGVIVVIEAKHLCMCARGVSKQHSLMVTSSLKGALKKTGAKSEFMELIK